MGSVIEPVSPAPAAIECALPWGVAVRGVRWGSGADRVLFLHEPGTDLDAWLGVPSRVAGSLPVKTFAYDLPGHGLSDDPWDPVRLDETVRIVTAQSDPGDRMLVVTAGDSALATIGHAAERGLAGIVCLSPPSSSTSPRLSPCVPKLFFAGSRSGVDLQHARLLAARCGGWSMVTAIPVDARGTALLTSAWGERITEQIVAYVRDCLYSRPPVPGAVPAFIAEKQG